MSGEDDSVALTQVELQDWGSVGAAEQKTAASPSAPVRVSPPAHAAASLSGWCPHVVEDLTLRPAADADVVNVDMNYFVLGLTDIVKGGEQTFKIDFYYDLYWVDPRLVGKDGHGVDWKLVWNPEVEITNALEADKDFENYELDTATGKVTYQTRYKALIVADFMDLKMFPFDAQLLNVGFESSAHTSDEVALHMFKGAASNVQSALIRPGGLAEWEFSSVREVERLNLLEFDQTEYSGVEVQVVVKRLSGYYVKKIMVRGSITTDPIAPPPALPSRLRPHPPLFARDRTLSEARQ